MTLVCAVLLASSAQAQGIIAGTVASSDGRPVESASVRAVRTDRSTARDVVTDPAGRFRLAALPAGAYSVTVHRIGYRSAELPGVRVADGQTQMLTVILTQAPTLLSTIEVVVSPTSLDASTPALTMRLDRSSTALLPSARDASSLIALVPGARKDQLWGGAPGVSNNYQVDGVGMNHPGLGGDFLGLSVDWIDALEITGLGAGAEHGNFQGGIINAITKTGTNERRYAIRTNYESPGLTATNFDLDEQGVEQAGRREIGGEALGPLSRDRLFYFVAGQYVGRDLRSPNLTTPGDRDFQSTREEQVNSRAIAKLTWLPALGQRVDLLAGVSTLGVAHAGINGVDDATATQRVSNATSYYGLSWNNSSNSRNQVRLRVAGFTSGESRAGYKGPETPGVHLLQAGRQPKWQNAAFNERRDPSSVSALAEWRTRQQLWTEHQLLVGGEVSRGRWRDERTRNGGLTWRPYPIDSAVFNPIDPTTWVSVGSEWGGDIRLDSDVGNESLFLQDQFALGTRLTLTPGIRYGRWSGYIRPPCGATSTACYRFEAVHAEGLDPRIGVAWDVTGRNTLAVKAHWGRYHQGMYSLFFDRAEGANVYANQRFYYSAPPLTTLYKAYTTSQRDAPGAGFQTFGFSESILDASGRVEGYRQPYVDQAVLAVEKSFGSAWKAEVIYTSRRNGDIVGLVDRNLATNYTPLRQIYIDNRYVRGVVLDAHGNPLVLPQAYVANTALQEYLAELNGRRQFPAKLFGYDTGYIRALTWNPDVVLSTVPAARRRYDQVTVMLRTVQPGWRAEGSLTGARLKGNVPGVTGYGTTATRFSAGPFVNPNEAINGDGYLPDALEAEGKLWVTARLGRGWQGGVLYTHTFGERFAASFTIEGRYAYSDSTFFTRIPDRLFRHAFGQSLLVEPRGSRRYASRDVLDAHLEWHGPRRVVWTFDLFNVTGENALVLVKTALEDQYTSDPTSRFGAARLRVPPRTLRVGLRVE